MTTDTKIHEPITLVGGAEFCIEGQCDHMPDEDEVGPVEDATCPMLDEVIVCGRRHPGVRRRSRTGSSVRRLARSAGRLAPW